MIKSNNLNMKQIIILVLLITPIIFGSCKSDNGTFDWLLGTWEKGKGEGDPETTFEIWEKVDNSHYRGLGFTMIKSDTIRQESIKLTKTNEKWNLEVKSPNDSSWTPFEVTSIEDKKFICENNELEFPNKIKYWKSKNILIAIVSGIDQTLVFKFKEIGE